MKEYAVSKIRNVCLLGHGGTGKTTLTEAMLYNTGVLERFGKVLDGTTTSDYDPEEIKRKFSISTAIAPCEWKGHKINVIDTPGYFDFVGEVKQGIRVAEGSIILLTAKAGIEVGTEKSWEFVQERDIPVFFYINKLDEENANFPECLQQLKDTFGRSVLPFQLPIYDGGSVKGYVDVLGKKAYKFENGKAVETEVPADMANTIEEVLEQLNEAIAETDEELMEKYFSGESFTDNEIKKGIGLGLKDRSICPVFCGVAQENIGVSMLMDAIISYMPAPDANPVIKAKEKGR